MKKSILLLLILAGLSAGAQTTKHLPKEVVIKMSDQEYIQFYRKIDSLMNITQTTSVMPSNVLTPFMQRFGILWFSIDQQVAKQMVVDSVKHPVKDQPKKQTN